MDDSLSLRISVLICTFNRAEGLARTLQSLSRVTPPSAPMEVVIVDNNSRDHTAAVVEDFRQGFAWEVKYVFEERQGLAHARNASVNAAKGTLLLFADDDVDFDVEWITAYEKAFFSDPSCHGAGGRIKIAWPGPKPAWIEGVNLSALGQFDGGDSPVLSRAPFGANMAARADVFERYGMFDTSLGNVADGRRLGEESELFSRLMKAGERIKYVPEAVVYHRVREDQLTMRFFRSHYRASGVFEARSIDGQGRMLCSVPLYLWRQLLIDGLGVIRHLFSPKRALAELQLSRTCGAIQAAHAKFSRRAR